MMMDKALSVKQPWAWAMFYPVPRKRKTIGNRIWDTTYRGRLWIHATKLGFSKMSSKSWKAIEFRQNMDTVADLANSVCIYQRNIFFINGLQGKDAAFVSGAIIGHVDLVGIVHPDDYPANEWHIKGNYGWRLANPVALKKPIFCNGKIGLWNCTDLVKEPIYV